MREKVLVFGSNFALATRIADLVRREFEVVLFEFSPSIDSDPMNVATAFTGKLLSNAIAYHGARYVVFTSESLLYINSPTVLSGLLDEFRSFKQLYDCYLAYVEIDQPIVVGKGRYIQALHNDSVYGDRITLLRQTMACVADSILEVQSVYTPEEDHWGMNFLRLIFDSKGSEPVEVRESVGDWEALSADDVARALIAQLGQTGTKRLSNGPYPGGLQAFCSAAILEHESWLKPHSSSHPNHCVQEFSKESLEIKPLYALTRQSHCSVNYLYRKAPEANFGSRKVSEFRYELGYALAKSIPHEVANNVDMIVPVPETGKIYAMGLADCLNIPYVEAIFKSDRKRSFDIESFDLRKDFLYSRLNIVPDLLSGKSVMVVDEAIFTGATLMVVSRLLRDAEVHCVYFAIPSPEARYSCKFNMQPKRDLLSEYVRKEDLWTYFNVEAVFFQNDEAFIQSVEQEGPQCVACFIQKGNND
jgi:adenine/guanine phosphoribosyltransferase-like PRPP-binding protein